MQRYQQTEQNAGRVGLPDDVDVILRPGGLQSPSMEMGNAGGMSDTRESHPQDTMDLSRNRWFDSGFSLRDEYSRKLAFYGRLLRKHNYVSGCDGNLSVRLGRDCVLTTPTGFSKAFLRARDIVMVDLSGKKICGLHAPTSEIGVHLTIYKLRPDIAAVVHAHPCVATGFASAGLALTDPVCSELLLTLGEVPLAPYAPPGSEALSHALEPFIAGHNAILMQNHGVVAYSENLERAYLNIETVEHCASIMLVTKLLGRCTLLAEDESRHLRARYCQRAC